MYHKSMHQYFMDEEPGESASASTPSHMQQSGQGGNRRSGTRWSNPLGSASVSSDGLRTQASSADLENRNATAELKVKKLKFFENFERLSWPSSGANESLSKEMCREAAGSLEVHRRLVVTTYLSVCGIVSIIQAALMLSAPLWDTDPLQARYGSPRDKQALGVAPACLSAVCACVAAYNQFMCKDKTALHLAEIILFLSPAVFVGSLDSVHSRSAVLWSFLAPLLRCTFSKKHDLLWKIWTALYVAAVIALQIVNGYLEPACSPDDNALPGWVIFLYAIHHFVPTTLFLIPLSLTSQRLLNDEKRDQVRETL